MDFFERLKEETIRIYAASCSSNIGWIAPYDDYVKHFERINWDSKKFYVDMALDKIYLENISALKN